MQQETSQRTPTSRRLRARTRSHRPLGAEGGGSRPFDPAVESGPSSSDPAFAPEARTNQNRGSSRATPNSCSHSFFGFKAAANRKHSAQTDLGSVHSFSLASRQNLCQAAKGRRRRDTASHVSGTDSRVGPAAAGFPSLTLLNDITLLNDDVRQAFSPKQRAPFIHYRFIPCVRVNLP